MKQLILYIINFVKLQFKKNKNIRNGGINMFCSKCGKQIPDTAKFCGGCGNPTPSAAKTSPPPAPAVSAPVPPAPPTPAAAQAPEKPETPATVTTPPAPPAPAATKPTPPVPPAPAAQTPTPPSVAAFVPTPGMSSPTPSANNPPVGPSGSTSQSGGNGNFKYTIFGANLPAVSLRMNAGDCVYTQSGGMVWMDDGIQMETNMKGGFLKGIGRKFAGESLFMVTYTATRPNQEIVMASSFPGSIVAIELRGNSVIAQKTAFLCAQPNVEISVYMTKSFGAGLFGGEGFILQRLNGHGFVFLEMDGSLVERVLAPGEKIKVDTGNVAAFEESVQYQAEMIKGFKNVLFGGEGLFLTTLTGPGKVWLQSMTLPTFAKQLIPYMPRPSN